MSADSLSAAELPASVSDDRAIDACYLHLVFDAIAGLTAGENVLFELDDPVYAHEVRSRIATHAGAIGRFVETGGNGDATFEQAVTSAVSVMREARTKAMIKQPQTVGVLDLDLLAHQPAGHAMDACTRTLVMILRHRPPGLRVIAYHRQGAALPASIMDCFSVRLKQPRVRPDNLPDLISRPEALGLFGRAGVPVPELVAAGVSELSPGQFRAAVRRAQQDNSGSLVAVVGRLTGRTRTGVVRTFAHVAGKAAVKQALLEAAAPRDGRLGEPDRRTPVVLIGPVGSGRRRLAAALAGQVGLGFFEVAVGNWRRPFHGETESAIRATAAQVVGAAPCVLAIADLGNLSATGPSSALDANFLSAVQRLVQQASGAGVLIVAFECPERPIAQELRALFRVVAVPAPTADERAAILADEATRTGNIAPGLLAKIVARTSGFADEESGRRYQPSEMVAIAARLPDVREKSPDEAENVLFGTQTHRVTLADVGGLGSIVARLEAITAALGRLAAGDPSAKSEVPSGILLHGPPGTGKTLLARAMGAQAGVPVIRCVAGDLRKPYVGESEQAVKAAFLRGGDGPKILLVDECDAVFGARGSGRHPTDTMVLTAFLTHMDGLQGRTTTLVVATTNNYSSLDTAILRSGRLEEVIEVGYPDAHGRAEILQRRAEHHRVALGAGEIRWLAAQTGGLIHPAGHPWSGAFLDGLVRAIKRRAGTGSVLRGAMEGALAEVDRRPATRVDQSRVALHEAGHVIVALVLPFAPVPLSVSVSVGFGATTLASELPVYDRPRVLAAMAVLLGGRAAEIAYLNASSGAEDDLRRATELARSAVARWGLDGEIGPMYLADSNGNSVRTATLIEDRVRVWLAEAGRLAESVISISTPAIQYLRDRLIAEQNVAVTSELRAAVTALCSTQPAVDE